MDLKELKKMISLMNENDLLELEIEEGGKKLRLKKAGPQGAVGSAPPPPAAPAAPAVDANAAAGGEAEPSAEDQGLVTIRSPMVGTYYQAPSPDADVYVEYGSKVSSETVVCIVEAMKVMNEIKAEVSGEIVKVCVKNGEAVEYGQALFLVKPA